MGQSRQIGDVRDESGSPPIAPALANRSNNGLGHQPTYAMQHNSFELA
jgi:hypothetical protein